MLPLKNLSGDPGQQYFADGLTDELTADLARLGKLRVIAPASTMLFQDTHKPLPQIARELNVDAVVTGTVERSGNRVRVRTALVRAGTGEVLWAQSYDRDLGDALGLEGEVSQAIAREMGIKLTPETQQRLERKPTTNPEARDAYLRARYFFDKDDAEGATKCLQYLQEAIAKDPNYAAAYAGLSRCYDLASYFNLLPSAEADAKIKAAARSAVELDDELSEGHSELGDYYLVRAWDFGSAAREYKRAIDLDPNSSLAHLAYGYYFNYLGQWDTDHQDMRRARELDPLSLKVANDLAWAFMYARRYDEAMNQLRNVLKLDPDYRRARWGLAPLTSLKGMHGAIFGAERFHASTRKHIRQRPCSRHVVRSTKRSTQLPAPNALIESGSTRHARKSRIPLNGMTIGISSLRCTLRVGPTRKRWTCWKEATLSTIAFYLS